MMKKKKKKKEEHTWPEGVRFGESAEGEKGASLEAEEEEGVDRHEGDPPPTRDCRLWVPQKLGKV